MALKHRVPPITNRPAKYKDIDRSALEAIVQAAVNVELFTIPLYMTSLYSIKGTHQINGNNEFYLGRRWPGLSTSANPQTPNEEAFNAIFSVFVAEMLHLQLASNICKSVNVRPTFTSHFLMNRKYGWTCYGPNKSVIPHIIDLKDAIPEFDKIKVNIGPLNKNQIDLFIAIEQDENKAQKMVREDKVKKYFPEVPFKNWKIEDSEEDLPMFGTIGYMYYCMFGYLTIKYDDGTSLWDYVYSARSLQRDLFNVTTSPPPPSHIPEYPHMSATVDNKDKEVALNSVLDMVEGITEQGEGGGYIKELRKMLNMFFNTSKDVIPSVPVQFQPDKEALEHDYPSYNDKGIKEKESHDAAARFKYGSKDHYETFKIVRKLMAIKKPVPFETWEDWHAKKENKWTAEMLQTPDVNKNKYNLPATSDIADALNRLKENDPVKNYAMLSKVVVGAIKGVTTVMDQYWNSTSTSSFPYPSMAGSGDRMALCWAIFGKAPDLSLGIEPKKEGVLYHACQGMKLDEAAGTGDSCAAVEIFHTCRGSNTCAAEGGCGFVQSTSGGGSCSSGGGGGCGAPSSSPSGGAGCGSKADFLTSRGAGIPEKKAVKDSKGSSAEGNLCGAPPAPAGPYSAPSDNLCASYGGCAVPISASQIFPSPDGKAKQGTMELYDFNGTDPVKPPFNKMTYNVGDFVYDTAWRAYEKVLEHKQQSCPDRPKPSDIRLAFPPST